MTGQSGWGKSCRHFLHIMQEPLRAQSPRESLSFSMQSGEYSGWVISDQHAIFIWGGIIILPSSIALCPFVLDWLRDKLPGGCSGSWLPTAATCQRQGKRKRTLGREEIADTQASKGAMHFSYCFSNWGTCVRNSQPFACCRCYCCRSDLQGFACFWNPISFLSQADEALIYLFVKC